VKPPVGRKYSPLDYLFKRSRSMLLRSTHPPTRHP
jgi:hypothetical protein